MSAMVDPYFGVLDPARVHTGDASANNLQHTVDLCYVSGTLEVRGEPACDRVRALGRVAWNDARSPFRGTTRRGDIGILTINNSTTSRVWFTTPFTKGWDLFALSAVADAPDLMTGRVIEQIVSSAHRYDLNGGSLPVRDYGTGQPVHAPN